MEAIESFELSSALKKEYESSKKSKYLENIWRRTDIKGNLHLFKEGFFWDYWKKYFFLMTPMHIIYFKDRKTDSPSGFIPLTKYYFHLFINFFTIK